MYSNRKFQPATFVIADFGLPLKRTLSLLNCSYSDLDHVECVSEKSAEGDLLVLFHYIKNENAPPASVAHIRGHVIEYTAESTRLVCRSIPVPVELEDFDSEIQGAVIVWTLGGTRIRAFHALGRIWYSTHRDLNCLDQRWVENSETFGQILAKTPNRPLPNPGEVMTFNLQPGLPDSGHISWMRHDQNLFVMNRLENIQPRNINLGDYKYAIIYQPGTEKCYTISSKSFIEERVVRGNHRHIYCAYEKFLRSEEENFSYLSEDLKKLYQLAREKFVRHMASAFNRRYIQGAYVRVDPAPHRFLRSIEGGKPESTRKDSVISFILQEVNNSEPDDIANMVVQYMRNMRNF